MYWVAYGPMNAHPRTTPPQIMAPGSITMPVVVSITGLSHLGSYHYQLIARNAAGLVTSKDAQLHLGAPRTTTGPAASATVSGTVSPQLNPTTYAVEYGTTTAYDRWSPRGAAGSGPGVVDVAVALTNLAPSTTYHYRLVATNDVRTVVGKDMSFTTPAAELPAPSSPFGAGEPPSQSGPTGPLEALTGNDASWNNASWKWATRVHC